MKKIFIVGICLSLMSSLSNSLFGQRQVIVGISCEIHFHRPKFDCCRGFWFCLTNCHYIYNNGNKLGSNVSIDEKPNALFAITEDGKLELTILEDLEKNENYKEEDLSKMVGSEEDEFYIPEGLAKALGVKAIKIKAGEYKVEKKGNGIFGIVRFDVEIEK